jgi:hypothetical protein
MARKICTAGVMGSFSFMILNQDGGSAISRIRDEYDEIVTQHTDLDNAEQWTERKLRELNGKRYEAD